MKEENPREEAQLDSVEEFVTDPGACAVCGGRLTDHPSYERVRVCLLCWDEVGGS